MKDTHYPIDPQRCQEIFRQLTTAENSHDLLACLMDMQTRQGMDEAAAETNAKRCMRSVASQEGLQEALTEKASAVLDRIFSDLAKKKPEQRLEALHQFYFGLTLRSDPALAPFLEQGKSPEELYKAYRLHSDPDITPEELESRIRHAFARYRFPPHILRGLAWETRHGEAYFAAAEALGENGRNLKCLLTMDIWLHNPETMTLEEAAVSAGTTVETLAVMDALNRGYIARDAALTILTILGLSVAVFGMFQIISFLPEALMSASELAAAGGTLAQAEARVALARKWVIGGIAIEAGGLALNEFAGNLADRVGTFATGLSHMLRREENQTDESPDVLADVAGAEMGYVGMKPSPFVSMDLPDGEEDEDWEQAVF